MGYQRVASKERRVAVHTAPANAEEGGDGDPTAFEDMSSWPSHYAHRTAVAVNPEHGMLDENYQAILGAVGKYQATKAADELERKKKEERKRDTADEQQQSSVEEVWEMLTAGGQLGYSIDLVTLKIIFEKCRVAGMDASADPTHFKEQVERLCEQVAVGEQPTGARRTDEELVEEVRFHDPQPIQADGQYELTLKGFRRLIRCMALLALCSAEEVVSYMLWVQILRFEMPEPFADRILHWFHHRQHRFHNDHGKRVLIRKGDFINFLREAGVMALASCSSISSVIWDVFAATCRDMEKLHADRVKARPGIRLSGKDQDAHHQHGKHDSHHKHGSGGGHHHHGNHSGHGRHGGQASDHHGPGHHASHSAPHHHGPHAERGSHHGSGGHHAPVHHSHDRHHPAGSKDAEMIRGRDELCILMEQLWKEIRKDPQQVADLRSPLIICKNFMLHSEGGEHSEGEHEPRVTDMVEKRKSGRKHTHGSNHEDEHHVRKTHSTAGHHHHHGSSHGHGAHRPPKAPVGAEGHDHGHGHGKQKKRGSRHGSKDPSPAMSTANSPMAASNSDAINNLAAAAAAAAAEDRSSWDSVVADPPAWDEGGNDGRGGLVNPIDRMSFSGPSDVTARMSISGARMSMSGGAGGLVDPIDRMSMSSPSDATARMSISGARMSMSGGAGGLVDLVDRPSISGPSHATARMSISGTRMSMSGGLGGLIDPVDERSISAEVAGTTPHAAAGTFGDGLRDATHPVERRALTPPDAASAKMSAAEGSDSSAQRVSPSQVACASSPAAAAQAAAAVAAACSPKSGATLPLATRQPLDSLDQPASPSGSPLIRPFQELSQARPQSRAGRSRVHHLEPLDAPTAPIEALQDIPSPLTSPPDTWVKVNSSQSLQSNAVDGARRPSAGLLPTTDSRPASRAGNLDGQSRPNSSGSSARTKGSAPVVKDEVMWDLLSRKEKRLVEELSRQRAATPVKLAPAAPLSGTSPEIPDWIPAGRQVPMRGLSGKTRKSSGFGGGFGLTAIGLVKNPRDTTITGPIRTDDGWLEQGRDLPPAHSAPSLGMPQSRPGSQRRNRRLIGYPRRAETPPLLEKKQWRQNRGGDLMDTAVNVRSATQNRIDAKIKDIKDKFEELDMDKDGLLDFDEFQYLVKKGDRVITDRETTILFRTADANGDGKVHCDEFVEFVLSAGRLAAKVGADRFPQSNSSAWLVR